LLSQKGYEIIILDSFVHNQVFNQKNVTVIKKDFADKANLNALFSHWDIKAVMHFAALIDVGLSAKDPLRFYDNNVSKTIKLLEMMVKHNVKKFIFSSSCAIYGNPLSLPIKENHPKNPISPYGKSKLMVEMIIKDFHKSYDIAYVNLRYFNVAGAMPHYGLGEQHKPETHIIPLIIRAMLAKKPFYVFGNDYKTEDGSCIRDFIHIWDIAHAHWLALEYLNNGNRSTSFNLGSGEGFSVDQLVRAIEKTCSSKIQILHQKRRIGDPAILIADASKARKVLRWKPSYSDIDTIIKTAYEYEIAPIPPKTKQITAKSYRF